MCACVKGESVKVECVPVTTLSIQLQDANTIIGRGLFKKQTKLDAFIGLTVRLSTGNFRHTRYLRLFCQR